jgi:acyl-CoA thioesterase
MSQYRLDQDLLFDAQGPTQTGSDQWQTAVTISDRWQVIVGPNGGYIGALLLAAVQKITPDNSQSIRSVNLQFVSPSVPGEATLVLRKIKAGRSTSLYTAELSQNGRTIAILTTQLGAKRLDVRFNDQSMPTVGPPRATRAMDWERSNSKFTVPFRQHYEQRIAIGPLPGEKDNSGRIGGWMRFQDLRPLDAVGLLAMSDAWYPSVISRQLDHDVHVPTLDHTVHYLASDFSGFKNDAYVLFEFSTEIAADGYLIENGVMYAESGQLLAISRQLAAMVLFDS